MALVVASLGYVFMVPWDGPILLTLGATHGIHVADVLLLALLALVVLLSDVGTRRGSLRRCTLAAVLCGFLLMVTGAVRLLGIPPSGLNAALSVVTALILLSAAWVVVEIGRGIVPRADGVVVSGRVLAALVLAGLGIDAVFPPTGTLVSAVFLGSYLARRVRSRLAATVLVAIAVGSALATYASITDFAGIDVVMSADQGGASRSLVLGLIILVVAYSLPGPKASRIS